MAVGDPDGVRSGDGSRGQEGAAGVAPPARRLDRQRLAGASHSPPSRRRSSRRAAGATNRTPEIMILCMSLAPFHPVLQRWFSETIGTPTPVQLRGWKAIRERRHTLIAAPTGSGKTLAAFLTALDELYVESLTNPLPDEVRVVYVSPLKALSADIHKNLAEPRRGIKRIAEEMEIGRASW